MKIVCLIAALLATSVTTAGKMSNRTFRSVVQSTPERQTRGRRTSWDILEQRYKKIWESVDKPRVELPSMVVHLGASAGNQITLWAKSVNGRNAISRSWKIACPGTNAVNVEEEVHDPKFGVSKLAITRNDGNAAPLPCTMSMAGSSAEVIIPVLTSSSNQERFSFLAYSCNEPFSTKDRKGILARDLSLWLRMNARAAGEDSRNQLPERPQFVLGVGDQIYVDPDPDAKRAPLAFFKGDRSDDFLIDMEPDSLYKALDVVYRYNFSLPPLAWAFSKLPSFMMWDDHEIRDGWGSQGDEACDLTKGDDRCNQSKGGASCNPTMRTYFRIARHAFIAHQLLRSYAPDEIDQDEYNALVAGRKTLHRPFSHGERTHVLMLDSRSTRAPGRKIFEETAIQAVHEWLGRGRKSQGDLYVLTVGAPLFPSRTFAGAISAVKSELRDDLRDGWDSKANECSRKELLKMLANHFRAEENKNDRLLVISGDVHYSSLYFISLGDRVVGQEVVTSGIAHSLPGTARKVNWLLDSAESVEGFGVNPAGKINESATFAELIVKPGLLHQTPEVELVFHANGTRLKNRWWARLKTPGWSLGNTNLLATTKRPLWYHTYDYGYKKPNEHLPEADSKAYPAGLIPAGSIMPLLLERPSILLRRVVPSDIQAQSVFCTVRGTKYNSTLAQSWDLSEFNCKCEGLKP
jgi:PhoD-like phosphatase